MVKKKSTKKHVSNYKNRDNNSKAFGQENIKIEEPDKKRPVKLNGKNASK
jgi:hypothetical protein